MEERIRKYKYYQYDFGKRKLQRIKKNKINRNNDLMR